tara:strand:- start:21 stop:197 length:177 start_codon:yes stop_codon:yes gene_type:complete
MKIGQIVEHDGKHYQIMSVKNNMITAHSYGKDCGVDTIIYVSRNTGNVIATKAEFGRG